LALRVAKICQAPGVVAEERDLRERDRQERGDQQLVPGTSKQREARPTRGEQSGG
jgi:hypothetical protein